MAKINTITVNKMKFVQLWMEPMMKQLDPDILHVVFALNCDGNEEAVLVDLNGSETMVVDVTNCNRAQIVKTVMEEVFPE